MTTLLTLIFVYLAIGISLFTFLVVTDLDKHLDTSATPNLPTRVAIVLLFPWIILVAFICGDYEGHRAAAVSAYEAMVEALFAPFPEEEDQE